MRAIVLKAKRLSLIINQYNHYHQIAKQQSFKQWFSCRFQSSSNKERGQENFKQFISQYLLIMSNHGIRYIANDSEREFTSEAIYNQKARQTYISPNKDIRTNIPKDLKPFTTSPARFGKPESPKNHDNIPPRAVPFRRSRNQSIDKGEKDRSECQSFGKKGEDGKRQVLRFSAIKKKLDEQMRERQRLQELSVCQQMKISNLSDEINKLRGQNKQLSRFLLEVQKSNEEGSLSLAKAQQNIQQLTKNLREARINQKSLGNLKNIQNQLEYLQERNKKLTHQNQQLQKQNKNLKHQFDKLRESTSESDNASKNGQSETQMKKLLGDIQKKKSERQKLLQGNLRMLEKKLYETENQMKKVMIQLNCIDRKKVLSIDEVKTKKDQQIKDLRQRFMKVAKDLRETKDKIEKNEKNEKKRNIKQSAFLRKVKSSKNIGMTSQSQQVTFELSSQV